MITLRVAVVERNRPDLNEDLAGARGGHGSLFAVQGVEALQSGDPLLDRHDAL